MRGSFFDRYGGGRNRQGDGMRVLFHITAFRDNKHLGMD